MEDHGILSHRNSTIRKAQVAGALTGVLITANAKVPFGHPERADSPISAALAFRTTARVRQNGRRTWGLGAVGVLVAKSVGRRLWPGPRRFWLKPRLLPSAGAGHEAAD